MSTSKATAGPWTYKATAGNQDFAVYPEAIGRDVALVREFNEANARLIAAAPEMRDMLQAAAEDFEALARRTGAHIQTYANTSAKSIRALLARIDGTNDPDATRREREATARNEDPNHPLNRRRGEG